jgi:hypothetical protein
MMLCFSKYVKNSFLDVFVKFQQVPMYETADNEQRNVDF